MATPNLSTQLPWQSLAAGGNALAGLGGDPQAALGQLGQNYGQQYQAALGMNQALYQGTQTGYDQLRSQVDDQYRGVLDGYGALYSDVLGRIAGSNASNLSDINTQYNAQLGSQAQNAVSRGLGNSTVAGNMMRGVEADRARAITQSQNQFAQLGANYAASIGGNRLSAQQQGIGLGANLGQAQLGALERVNAPYPDAGMYGSLAQMYGQQAERNRGQRQTAADMWVGDSRAAAGRPGSPSPWGSRDPSGGGYATMAPSTNSNPFFNLGGGGGFSYGGGGGPSLSYDSGYGSMYQDGYTGSDFGGGDFGGGYGGSGSDYMDSGGNFDYGSFADYAAANPQDFGGYYSGPASGYDGGNVDFFGDWGYE